MAQYFGLGGEEPSPDSERIVARALRQLPEEWTVLHSVTWQSVRNGRQGDGEADFLVIHPTKGILILEVKGGGIHVDHGQWRSTDRNDVVHPIKNPYKQASDSKYALLSWLTDRQIDARVRVGHAVVFPHQFDLPDLGPSAPPEITLTRSDLEDVERKLLACFRHWDLRASLTESEMRQIVGALAPTLRVNHNLRSQAAEAEMGLMALTAEQIDALSGLKSSRGGLVLGGAGTGKTVLAVARAQQLAREGFHTLLVCFNELLGEELCSRVGESEGIAARTFHSLCFREAGRAGLNLPSTPSKEWWDADAPQALIESCAINQTSFDAVVVDEGQDFAPLWLDSLRCLTSTTLDAPFFVFADPRQDIWTRNWRAGIEYDFCYTLNRNMRNTQPIAEKIAASVGAPAPTRGVPGPVPRWRQSPNPRSLEGEVVSAVERLLDQGFTPANLVVLCESSILAGRLRERSVGAYSFGGWGSRGIPVETIARFKGLESEAAVLVLEEGETEDCRTTAYVGMSRARSVLVVVGPPRQQAFLRWLS